jgi:hypothetical protein
MRASLGDARIGRVRRAAAISTCSCWVIARAA